MYSPESQFDPEWEAELRAVPLPDGLLRRLRQAALADDPGLDAAVREVPLPRNLMAKLRAAAYHEDESLDAAVREVPLPAGFSGRLQAAILEDDEALDEALREVPLPTRALAQLRRAVPSVSLGRLAHWATVASLAVAVGLSYLGAMLGFLAATRRDQPSQPSLDYQLTLRMPVPADEAQCLEVILAGGPAEGPAPIPAEDVLAGVGVPEFERFDSARPSAVQEALALFSPRAGRATPEGLIDLTLYFWGKEVLAANGEIDRLPDLKKVVGPAPQGMQPPLVAAFPLREFNQTGVFPFVSPAAHYQLQNCQVPLGVDTASYELTRRYLEDGELPPPDRVRTEEFLAALDYDFPPPKNRPLGVVAAGGPSPFGGEGLTLLHVGLRARDIAALKHPPTHLVLAVDVSSSMRWGGRIEMVRRALAEFSRSLGPEDRLSLVTFSDDAAVVFEEAAVDEAPGMAAVFAELPIRAATNLGAGLGMAYEVARRSSSEGRLRRIILLTDGAAELDRAASRQLERRLAACAGDVRLDAIDLNQGADPDLQLAAFAQAGRGKCHRAVNADQIGWALAESLSGRPQLVAADTRLKVTFNPKTVVVYRLLGHEPSALGKVLPGRLEADFQAGQSGSGLFELVLTAGGEQEVAVVEVSWQPPEGGPRQQLVHRVTRRDFASTFGGAAASLQAAALAARTAEVLRTPRIPRTARPLAEVLQWASDADTGLLQRPSYLAFLELVRQADKAKPYRPGVRK